MGLTIFLSLQCGRCVSPIYRLVIKANCSMTGTPPTVSVTPIVTKQDSTVTVLYANN